MNRLGGVLAPSLVLVALAAGGCATPLQYTANDQLVTSQGLDATRSKLKEVMMRAVVPRVVAVDISDDNVDYKWTQQHMGAFYQVSTITNQQQMYFTNMESAELYSNHYVYVWRNGRSGADQILFAGEPDAKSFIDNLWSLRANRLAKK